MTKSDLSDEDLGFTARYVRPKDRLIPGGSDISETGLEVLKAFQAVKYPDLRGPSVNDFRCTSDPAPAKHGVLVC